MTYRLPCICEYVNIYLDQKQENKKRSEWTVKGFNQLVGVDNIRKVFPRSGDRKRRPALIIAARTSLAIGKAVEEVEKLMFFCGYEWNAAINDSDMSDVVIAIRVVLRVLSDVDKTDEAKKINIFNLICDAAQKFDEEKEKEKKQNKEDKEKNK